MKSFRIPVSQMSLSADAYAAAIEVDSIEKGEEFLDNFGSHVSAGRHEVPHVFGRPHDCRRRLSLCAQLLAHGLKVKPDVGCK